MTFTENDIYVIKYCNKDSDNRLHEEMFTIIGETEANELFDFVCNHKFHDEVILSKGKIVKYLNNCVVDDVDIRRWKKEDAISAE